MIEPVQTQPKPKSLIQYYRFPYGLRTNVSPDMLDTKELAECVDFKMLKGGKLKSRGAFQKYNSTAITGTVAAVVRGEISGTTRDIVASSNGNIYYLNGVNPVLIGTADGEASLVPYKDRMMIMDGSYLKYLDGITDIQIAYDDGSGGFVFDYTDNEDTVFMGCDSTRKIGCKITTEAWTSGYTIPPTRMRMKLKKIGSPTGDIVCSILKESDLTVMASATLSTTADGISTAGAFYEVDFDTVTNELEPGVLYFACIENFLSDETGGDYIQLRCSTDGSGYYRTGVWQFIANTQPLMSVSPGTAPKASFGIVAGASSGSRLWLAGDPDNPGYAWYGGLTYLDWSTSDLAGFLGVIDSARNSYPIGAIGELFGEVYFFGTEDQAYVSKLNGAEPSVFSAPSLFQNSWSTPKTLVNIKNDLWIGSGDGVDSLRGVELYGDVRTFSESDQVSDRLDNWSSSTAIAGYYPEDGQYWLWMPTLGKILCFHTKIPIQTPEGIIYSCTEYDPPMTPTCFGQLGGTFIIGGSDGYLYEINEDSTEDLETTKITPVLKTARTINPFGEVNFIDAHFLASSDDETVVDIDFYVNRKAALLFSEAFTIPTGDTALNNEIFSFDTNFDADAVQVGLSGIELGDDPLYFEGILLKYRTYEG